MPRRAGSRSQDGSRFFPYDRHVSSSPLALARHCSKDLRRHWLRQAGLVVLSLVLFVVTSAGLLYRDLQGQIERQDVSDLIVAPLPRTTSEPLPEDSFEGFPVNILIMGSDARGGQAVSNDGTEGMRSDTTMLMHISKDRSRIDVVSIPRDTMVPIPSCTQPDGSTTYAQRLAQFNSAFSLGSAGSTDSADVKYAAACTLATVQQMSGMDIPDYMVVDFDGFEQMINALGGVPMYVEESVMDRRANLYLDAGCQHLDGATALAFARARYSLGDGSDLSRIGRQQELVSSIIRTALSKNLATDLPSLYAFAQASLSSLTVSPRLGDLQTLAGLALSVKNLGMDQVNFVTLPVQEYPADHNRVIPSAQAEAVWEALRTDTPVPAETVSVNGDGQDPAQIAAQQEASAAQSADPAGSGGAAAGDAGGSGQGAPTSPSPAVTTPPLSPAQQCYRQGS